MCNSLGKFIRFNTRIQTIILNNSALNSQLLVGLVPYLRHAKSLLCLHLASNPGINKEVLDYYCERLKILPVTTLKVKVMPEELEPFTIKDIESMT